MSKLEATLALHIRAHKLPEPVREYRFHPTRRWRMDFAWPDLKLAAEVQGGIWTRGRHSRGKGMEADMEKHNEAMLLGWDVLLFSGGMIDSGQAVETIRMLIELKGARDA